MLHFVKNEEKYFISNEDSKWEFTLNTNEDAKLFYEILKEKKRIEIAFYYNSNEYSIFHRYDDNLRLDITSSNYEEPFPLYIMADYENIMIAGNDVRDGAMNLYIKLGEIIGTSVSLPVSDFSSLISNLGGDTISLVLEIKEDQKEPLVPEIKEDQKEPNNIYLVLFIMFIIFLINCMFINFLA